MTRRAQVKMLLTCEGVAVDSRNADDETALMHAAAGSHMSIVSELVKHGADTKAVDKHGKTPTDWVRVWRRLGGGGRSTALTCMTNRARQAAKRDVGNMMLVMGLFAMS